MKKRILAVSLIIGLLLTGTCLNYFKNKPKFTLHLPEINALSSVFIKETKITDRKQIEELVSILNEGRTTKEESIQDSPVNTDELIQLTFQFENGSSDLYVYQRNHKFYIEQPYNGVYEITENEYEKIKILQ